MKKEYLLAAFFIAAQFIIVISIIALPYLNNWLKAYCRRKEKRIAVRSYKDVKHKTRRVYDPDDHGPFVQHF